MTKLSEMDLPRNQPMYKCPICNEWAESAEQVKFQAKALLELHFELDDDHFCEECFWK